MEVVSAGKDSTASFGPSLFLMETEACKWVVSSPSSLRSPNTSSAASPALGEGAEQVHRPLIC